jgi:hypothetical protein
VLNVNNPTVLGAVGSFFSNGGTPWSPQNLANQAPFFAQCSNPTVLTCTARVFTFVDYLNYSPNPLDNWSLRFTYYHDEEGQRTGVASRFIEVGLGLQHWLSPQIEIRPEISWMRSLNAPAFDANLNPFCLTTPGAVCAPTRNYQVVGASDIIFHF